MDRTLYKLAIHRNPLIRTCENMDTCIFHTLSHDPKWCFIIQTDLENQDYGWSQCVHNTDAGSTVHVIVMDR